MSTVTYIGDEPREVAILPDGMTRVLEPDQKFTVPDEFDRSYACQPQFYEVDGMPWPPDDENDGMPEDVGTAPPDDAPAPSQPVKKTSKSTTAKEN